MSGIIEMLVGGSTAAAAAADPYFNYTTLLLPGNGTNGAQNNTYLDSSSNNFTITRTGNVAQGTFSPFSQTGWSGYFDGSGDYLTLASNIALSMGTGDFTVEMWVYSTDASVDTQNRRFFATDVNGTASIQIGHVTTTTGVAQYCDNGSLGVLITGTTNILNQWAHIAVVRSSGTVKLYVNGVSEGTPATDTGNKGSANFTIGKYPGASGHMKGNISNLRIVKGTAVYTANFTPSTTPLTAISGTSLLTCQSNWFVDNSTNNFTITRNGDTSIQAFSPFNPTAAYSAATVGGSGYFDATATGDWLSYSPGTTLSGIGTGSITIEAWVYFANASFSGYQDIFYTNSFFGPVLYNGRLMFYGMGATIAANSIPIRQWVHIAVVRQSGGTLKGYYNGVECFSGTSTNSVAGTTAYIGSGGSNVELFPGYISNVRVSNTARYTANFTPPTSPFTSDANTLFLLGCTNAGITDATAKNDLETVGNAQISTAQSKFGGSSMYFDGTGDYLTSPAWPTNRLMDGDFTVEMWVRLAAAQANMGLVSSFTTNVGWLVRLDTSAVVFSYGTGSASTVVSNSSSLSTGQWYHIAWTKSGTTLRSFVDGTQVGANHTVSGASDSTSIALQIGRTQTVTNDLNGYIDDLRITKGIARYTSNFTPPTAAFPTQ